MTLYFLLFLYTLYLQLRMSKTSVIEPLTQKHKVMLFFSSESNKIPRVPLSGTLCFS